MLKHHVQLVCVDGRLIDTNSAERFFTDDARTHTSNRCTEALVKMQITQKCTY